LRNNPVDTPHSELLVDAAAASRSLSISPRLLWSLTQSREIPSLRIGRRVLYPRLALEQWIESRIQRERKA
jgi:excisionase family DNA binding protein